VKGFAFPPTVGYRGEERVRVPSALALEDVPRSVGVARPGEATRRCKARHRASKKMWRKRVAVAT
jgi:hypothetical protein